MSAWRDHVLADGAQRFNQADYWHAHEVWEAGWIGAAEPRRTLYQGLIQAAAALVHWQRANLRGLHRNWYKARPRLVAVSRLVDDLDLPAFIRLMDRFVSVDGATEAAPYLRLIRLVES